MKVVATARCVGTVKRVEITASRHMGGVMRCWTDVTRNFMLTIPRDTFILWANELRRQSPFEKQRPAEYDMDDARAIVTWLKGKEVKIQWVVRESENERHFTGFAIGLAGTEQDSGRVKKGRKRSARTR